MNELTDKSFRLDEIPEHFDAVTSKIGYGNEAVLQNIKAEMNEPGRGSRKTRKTEITM